MPETSSEEKLAEDFADFFMDKIQKIRDAQDHHPTYKPVYTTAHCKMDSFEKMSEDDEERIIKKIQTKSCESDVLPTDLLKKSLKGSINIIRRILNLKYIYMSLRNEVFASKWKTSIIRPLLKKLGLDITLSNTGQSLTYLFS